jgi:heparanase 1
MRTTVAATAVAAAAAAALSATATGPVRLDPAAMKKVGEVDARYQSYNVEMVEVTGGRFWAPYAAATAAPEPEAAATGAPGLDPRLFRMRSPIDLSSARLRTLAAGLGPAYVRVSGSWANSTYFHDSDTPAPTAPPAGFGGVLTRAQWKGVVDFARAAGARLVTSFAISAGTRDAEGRWTPAEMEKLLAYTASIGGSVAAAEFFNEPNLAGLAGAPKGYDAAARTAATSRPSCRSSGRRRRSSSSSARARSEKAGSCPVSPAR